MREYAIQCNLGGLSNRAFIDFLCERIRDTGQFGLMLVNSVTERLLTFCMRKYAILDNSVRLLLLACSCNSVTGR